MKQYPASKTQLKALDQLGIDHPAGIGHRDAGVLLEHAGWYASGSGPDDRDAELSEYAVG